MAENSIVEFELADVVDQWVAAKFNDIRKDLHHILSQTGVILELDEETTAIVSDEELTTFLKENVQE